MNPVYWISQRLFRTLGRAFFDLQVIGLDNASFHGPALIASNHVSYLDPPLIGSVLPEAIHFLARKSLARTSIMAWLFRHWCVILVDRDKPDPSTLKSIFRALEAGRKVIVFPEGTRSPDGQLQGGEPGIGMMIARAGVPVLPARISGAHEALPRDRKFPRRARITVAFGEPWVCDAASFGKGKEAYQAISDEVMERIKVLPTG
jgi:1-acyl-sn-glycerol-3-phosphate acyltransferase